jgi:hypothetical protein
MLLQLSDDLSAILFIEIEAEKKKIKFAPKNEAAKSAGQSGRVHKCALTPGRTGWSKFKKRNASRNSDSAALFAPVLFKRQSVIFQK